ncbi:helicase RepA family protein [Bradyrhizobium sp. Bra78]|uniref:helicase RepA family protein n=1 Tax=Bradyrhizobium sp. Bra78 TaxID=2926010 RepID=UPI0021C7B963|nr:helicase RepA family protein [Bradyrhizobium sp. Bra78]
MSDDEPRKFQYALPYRTFDQCADSAPKNWLVENVIAFGEDSSWYGPPGEGKSGLLLDLAVHVASGRDWRGYKFNPDKYISENRGVVYFALERASLTERRMRAYMQRDGLSGLPIAISRHAIDLLNPSCVEIIRHTLLQFWDDTDIMPGLVIIDTWGKAIARGDADKEQTQNLAAMHIGQLREVLKGSVSRFHLASIGHSGKNLAAGERGSNARQGHVDLEIQINGGTAKITKANDQDGGELTRFEFEKVDIPGDDDRGTKPWSTTILATATPAKEARTAARQRTTGKQAHALDALRRAIVERGDAGAVYADFWKEELAKGGLIRADDKNPRATFARIRTGLSQHIIAEPNGLVRINPQPGQIPPSPA